MLYDFDYDPCMDMSLACPKKPQLEGLLTKAYFLIRLVKYWATGKDFQNG